MFSSGKCCRIRSQPVAGTKVPPSSMNIRKV
jgi:hypothetical protein